MPENEFEKQVQQLFDELKLKPSKEVWPNVSARIRKDKNRKRAFIWFPIALLLLSAGSFWLLQQKNNKVLKESPSASSPGAEYKNENTTEIQSRHQHITAPVSGNTQNAGSETPSDVNLHFQYTNTDTQVSKELSHSNKSPVSVQSLNQVIYPGRQSAQIPEAALSISNKDLFYASRQNISLKEHVFPEMIKGKYLNRISKVNFPEYQRAFAETTTPVKLTNKKTWEWGIAGASGISSVTDGISGLWKMGSTEKSAVSDFLNSPYLSANSGFFTSQNNMIAALPSPASPVKMNIAWQAGGFVKRKMNTRLAITSGLQYHYYSTRRMVGSDIDNFRLALGNTQNQVNASYGGYYLGGVSVNYTNRYHFLEIPAGVEWQVNKSGKVPLLLNGGINLSWLTNTTALHYHPQTGSYYKDKALFNTIQTGFYTGASFKFFADSRQPLYAGPVIRYHLTNLVNSSLNQSQHLVFVGLKAEWVLKKK